MAKNTAAKRREAEQEKVEARLAALAEAERRRAAGFIRALAAGAAFSALALWSARWGAEQLWPPYTTNWLHTLVTLTVSGLISGAMAAWLGGAVSAPVPAGACALGWALSATLQHVTSQGRFLDIIEASYTGEAAMRRAVGDSLALNPIYLSLCIALGLLAASFAGWCVSAATHPNRAPLLRPRLDRSPLFLLLCLLAGGAALWALSFVPKTVLAAPKISEMPANIAPAIMCAALTAFAFGLVTYNLGKRFKHQAGRLCFLAAPLLVLFTQAVLLKTRSSLLLPLTTLYTHASPFEVVCWGAFAAVAGFQIQLLNRDDDTES